MDGVNFLKNPVNKWMIWGGLHPYLWFNTQIITKHFRYKEIEVLTYVSSM